VLDTGVDEHHPALTNNFEKGRNFIINDQDQRLNESAYQDTDGHGTHCAGTILGDYNPQTGFTGIAPRAKLLAGRVCGDDGCSNISVVQGLDWAISEQVDVVNLSLGGGYYTPSEKQAIERAEKAGLVVVAASGNSADEQDYSPDKKICPGDSRYFPNKCGVGFPAAYSSVVAVGALDFNLERAIFSQWGPELDLVAPGVDVLSSVPVGLGRISEVRLNTPDGSEKIKSSLFSGASQGAVSMSGELVAVPGVGLATDFSSVDVAEKIALVSRGEIKFAEKIKNAIEARAKALVIYNNAPGLMQGDIGGDEQIADYPVVMIEQAEASDIVRRLSTNEQLNLNLDIHVTDYEMFEGTSMAAPHVSGVVALMRSANKRLRPSQIRQILSGTARELAGDNHSNQLGAGLVSAARAVGQSKSHH
jgi:serine protease